jgi:hypothetical protein
MFTFTRLALLCCLLAGMNGAVSACSTSYDPAAGVASVPCFDVPLEGRSSSVRLQSGGTNAFVLSIVEPLSLADPVIAKLHILTSPTPTAIVTGFYSPCGGGSISRPTFVRTGSTIDIRVKARVPSVRDWSCEASPWAMRPFAEAVRLVAVGDPQSQNYSVNGTPVEPLF